MAREASRTRIEARIVEHGGRLVEAQAPAHWTNARLDAWIDWAGGETDLPHAVAETVEQLTVRAQAKGLVKDVRARTRFRDGLTEALLSGTIAIVLPKGGAPVLSGVFRDWVEGCELCIEPSAGVFNAQAFQSIDYAIKAAHERGMRLIVTLVGDCSNCKAGGMGLVEDPAEAYASAMPMAALAACAEARPLPLDDIAAFLLDLGTR